MYFEDTTYDALIFDMDGTLWDAAHVYTKAWNDYFEVNQINKHFSDDHLLQYMGWEEEPYLAEVLPEYSIEKRSEIYKEVINLQYKNIDLLGGKLYDGVASGLARLSKKYKLFIVSNCAEHTITHFVRWSKIEPYITDHISYGFKPQPKSQNIKYLIDKYNLKSPVYIGDTQGDYEQSELVPLPFIYVSYGFGIAKKYHRKFDSFKELKDYFLALALFH